VWRTRRGDKLPCVEFPAEASVACITAAHQAATRFGERTCGAGISCEPLKRPGSGRATPVRTSIAARRRHHLWCVVQVQCWGWLAGA
jgi:hypothetical protein